MPNSPISGLTFIGGSISASLSLTILSDTSVNPIVSYKATIGQLVPVIFPLLGTGSPSSSNFLRGDGTWSVPIGTVTSFSAGNLSPLFTTSVATSTSTPALSFSLTNQNANVVLVGPSTGSAAAPTFRALVAADLPGGAYPISSVSGTANQITAATVSGAVTLSLPTSILNVNNRTSAAGSALTLSTGTSGVALTIASATNAATFANSITTGFGIQSSTAYFTNQVGIGTTVNSEYALAISGAISAVGALAVGVYNFPALTATAVNQNLIGTWNIPTINTGSSSYTGLTYYGIDAGVATASGNGTIANAYQIYVNEGLVTGGGVTVTNSYGVFQAGANLNYFNGPIQINNQFTVNTTSLLTGSTTIGGGGTSGANITFSGTTAAAPVGSFGISATSGLQIVGYGGSTYDFNITNSSGNSVIRNAHATQNLEVVGGLTVDGVSQLTGFTGIGEASASNITLSIGGAPAGNGACGVQENSNFVTNGNNQGGFGLYVAGALTMAANTGTGFNSIYVATPSIISGTLANGYMLQLAAPAAGMTGGFLNAGTSTLQGNLTLGTASGGQIVSTVSAGTNSVYELLQNTGNSLYFGLNSSAGSPFVGGSYASLIATGGAFTIITNQASSAAVAVTFDASQGATFTAKVVSTSPTAGVGYATGAGGTVVQATSKSTAFTLSKVTGQITFATGSLAGDTSVSATWTNTAMVATDVVVFTHLSGGTIGAYSFNCSAGAGSGSITVHNNTPGALNEQPVVQYTITRGATS